MKIKPLYFVLFVFYFQSHSQASCSDANSDVIYAYSHIKAAYESNNLDHLKYWSNRCLEVFEKAKDKLESCGCEKAYNHTLDIVELLSNVEYSETNEDGRFYVKRARDLAKEAINEFELCTELEAATIDKSLEDNSEH